MEFMLTTRKIVFGMLLVLVLAFSMQGIADAQDAGRLTVRVDPFDGAPGSKATVTFTAIGADNQPAFITVNLSATGGTLSRSSEWTGFAVTLTRGNTPGNENYVTASANDYASVRARFLINGMPTVAAAADLAIYNGNLQRGSLNVPLAEPFSVEVVDAHGDPIEDVRVRFQVPQGSGRFSPRTSHTDARGRVETTLTPTSAGRIIVEATVGGVDKTLEFIVSVEEAPEAADPVIFSTRIAPKVLVAVANRPPMLWVDSGAIYGLVGANAQRFAPSVDNAMNIAVDASNGKVYWTEKTGESRGTINSANLDGTSVTELTSILSVPMGIAVDATGSKPYWTNARGRIQSANLDGSGIQNVLQDLSAPTDIVVSNGFIYWTEGSNSIRRVNISGQKITQDIAANLGSVGGLAVGGGKVYWTEKTGKRGGTINSANADGTGATVLTSILATPMGIAVDTVGSNLYWTNARGRVQRANLDGSGIQNVVEGLGGPGKIVISNSLSETAAGTPLTPPVSYAPYDVNKDGAVDNTDAGLVIDALGTRNARYDVNGDGTVNFLDVVLVFDNRDAGVAAAPTIVGNLKLTAIQIESHRRTDRSVDCDERSVTGSDAGAGLYAAASRDGDPSGENAVVCELSESVQPRNVDSVRVGDGYACQDHDLQHTRCCDPDVAVWASICWLLHGSGSCGVLGWSECVWRTGCERFVFLSARNRRNVVDAEDGYFEIVSNDHRIAGMLMFISFPVIADEWVELGSLASSLRNDAFGDQRF